MNRTALLMTAAVTLTGFISAGPAFAQSSAAQTTISGSQSGQQIVNDAAQTVQQIKADPRFDALLKKSKGVFIMPELVKGAFIIGGAGAQGVLLKHESDGSWSQPAFLNIGSISLGAQAGGKAGPAAMILMTDKALSDFTQQNNFSLNGNAGLTIINYSAQGQAPIGKGDIIIWSSQSGAFAGVDVNGADITQNTSQDHAYYNKQVDAQQILNGDVAAEGAKKLMMELPG